MLFTDVTLAPPDPILGLTEKFKADPRSNKVNLGVGVYLDENGNIPLLKSVAESEKYFVDKQKPHGYLAISGLAEYNQLVQKLVFSEECEAIAERRIVTVESIAGTGALKVGADFLNQINPESTVWISNPTWPNHRTIFVNAGFKVEQYSYYDADNHSVDFEGLLANLHSASFGDVVVLHACCHNPTGYDLSEKQWKKIVDICAQRNLVAFLDMAYQGFAVGINEDNFAIKEFVKSGLSFFVANSFSKTFSLYGERVGALSIVTANEEEAERVLSQVKIVIRSNYSNPPTFGAAIVSHILATPQLRNMWENELTEMRERIRQMRVRLNDRLVAKGIDDMGFILDQRGMFSFSGLSKTKIHRMRDEFGIYAIDSGRICVAALNDSNLETVAQAIVAVR